MKIFLFLLFLFYCTPPEYKSACDPTSQTFKAFLLLKLATNDKSSFCNSGTSITKGPGPLIISTDFVNSANITPLSPVVISKSQTLGITFDTRMLLTGCEIVAKEVLAPNKVTTIQTTATTSTDERTLFLKPTTPLPINILDGYTLDLSANCKSQIGGSYVPGTGIVIYIADTLTYVAPNGSDANTGTLANPVLTIQKGIDIASSTCSSTLACAIAVKAGIYDISSPIIITPPTNTNISLFGGFDSGDWTKRRADKTALAPYDTIINDTSINVTDNTSADPYMPLKYLGTSGPRDKNIIDGIIINGPISGLATKSLAVIGAVNLQSTGGVTIRNTVTNDRSSANTSVTSSGFMSGNNSGKIFIINNSFNGSTTSIPTSSRYGMVYFGATATSELNLTNSIVTGGLATATSSGSGFFSTGTINGIINITKNTITAPICTTLCTGSDASGISGNMNTATISTNIINGSSTPGPSRGISLASGTVNISENTITSGVGQNSAGISLTTIGSFTVSKNIITSLAANSQNSSAISIAGTASLNADNNTITSGATNAAGAHSYGINLSNTVANSITNNKINSGTSNSTTSFSAGIGINGTAPNTISNNIITANTASGANAFGSAGILVNANSNITLNTNTVIGGDCTALNCVSAGILQIITATVNGTGNTFTGGNCTGTTCSTVGITLIGSPTDNSNLTLSNNTIKGGNCTTTTCTSAGFAVNISNASNYNLTNNTLIAGGNAVADSTGIRIASNNSTNTYSGNTISSGTCSGVSCSTFGMNMANGTNFTYTNNTISTGTCNGTTCTQTGLRQAANGSLVVIEGNTIDSGIPSANSTPISLDLQNWPNAASTSIQRNTFISKDGSYSNTGGTTVKTAAINSQMKFCSNVVVGGTKTNLGTAIAMDIASNSGGAIFMGNTIIPPTVAGGTSYGFRFLTNAVYTGLKLDQNIIYGNSTSTCVFENGASVGYSTLVKNSISNCSNLYNENGVNKNTYCTSGVGDFSNGTTNCSVQPLTSPPGMNNIDPAFLPTFTNFAGNDFHVTGPSQISQAILSADITVFNTSCGNSLDRSGVTRTNLSSIGAYK